MAIRNKNKNAVAAATPNTNFAAPTLCLEDVYFITGISKQQLNLGSSGLNLADI